MGIAHGPLAANHRLHLPLYPPLLVSSSGGLHHFRRASAASHGGTIRQCVLNLDCLIVPSYPPSSRPLACLELRFALLLLGFLLLPIFLHLYTTILTYQLVESLPQRGHGYTLMNLL